MPMPLNVHIVALGMSVVGASGRPLSVVLRPPWPQRIDPSSRVALDDWVGKKPLTRD
jgi:hypothetical protein